MSDQDIAKLQEEIDRLRKENADMRAIGVGLAPGVVQKHDEAIGSSPDSGRWDKDVPQDPRADQLRQAAQRRRAEATQPIATQPIVEPPPPPVETPAPVPVDEQTQPS